VQPHDLGGRRIVRVSAIKAASDGPSDNSRQNGRTDEALRERNPAGEQAPMDVAHAHWQRQISAGTVQWVQPIMSSSIVAMPSVLCRALGAYWERLPHPALEVHFVRTWFHVRLSAPAEALAVVPDGYADLQWVNGELRVAGPDRTVNDEALPAGTIVVGLRFQPASVGPWLGSPASELVNARIPLEEFWGAEARRLAANVSEGRSPDAIARRLEAALVERAAQVRAPDPAALAIFRVVGTDPSCQTEVTRQACEVLGMSERTLRRRSLEAFGYGPKTLHRILRFQRFLRMARAANSGTSLAQLAMAAGYADQAHLSREARELAGMTPATVLGHLA
jgi:AraC-like DNA-binding protein